MEENHSVLRSPRLHRTEQPQRLDWLPSPCFRPFLHFFDPSPFSLFLLCTYISRARSVLCCLCLDCAVSWGSLVASNRNRPPAKRIVNGDCDGKAEEPGPSEPATGGHQPPASLTHVALGIPRRKKAGLWDPQPRQECTAGERIRVLKGKRDCRLTKRKRSQEGQDILSTVCSVYGSWNSRGLNTELCPPFQTASPSFPGDSRARKFSPRHPNPKLSFTPQVLLVPSCFHGLELCLQPPLAVKEAEKGHSKCV